MADFGESAKGGPFAKFSKSADFLAKLALAAEFILVYITHILTLFFEK